MILASYEINHTKNRKKQEKDKSAIIKILGTGEYERLMGLSVHEFDQTSEGFRQYSGNYELVSLIIPEYIGVNGLSLRESRNLHWHMGQIHAFNGYSEDAIREMKQSFEGGTVTWSCYVNGTIAFLEKDKASLLEALVTLKEQENQMNIEILERFLKYFDASYAEAMNNPN